MLPENNFYVVGSQQQYPILSASSASGVVNNLLIVSSETFTSSTVSGRESGVVWAVNVAGSTCSDEYYDYQGSTEKVLCHSGFLQQNTANPSHFYILCPYFLATEQEAIKYVVSKFNELGDCYAQSSSL